MAAARGTCGRTGSQPGSGPRATRAEEPSSPESPGTPRADGGAGDGDEPAGPGAGTGEAAGGAGRPGEQVRLPRWWRELAGIAVIYGVYTAIRGFKNDDLVAADRIGWALLNWERAWNLDPEQFLNDILTKVTALAVPACYFYATLHYILTPVVLVWMYRRHPRHYLAARSTLLLATLLGLIGFWLLPTTPPRLLDGSGLNDTMAQVSAWGWWGGEASAPRGLGGLTNQYAAMPSLHCGWALWVGYLLVRHARRPWARAAGMLYPLLTTLVVMATANHYFLDAVAGFAVIGLAAAVVALVRRALARRQRLAPATAPPDPGTSPATG